MGRYAIVIVAVGSNHNADHPGDADKMAHQFCNKLREAGHNIESAEFQLIGPNAPEPLLEGVPTTGVFQQHTPAAPAPSAPAPAAEAPQENAAPAGESGT
jgi:hypothetical protein